MKKALVSFVLSLICSGVALADSIVINKNNLDSYLESAKPWSLQNFDKPMYIVNKTGELLFIDVKVDYGVSDVSLSCNSFIIGTITSGNYSGCLIKNNDYAWWNKEGKGSSGTFTLFRAGEIQSIKR